MVDSQETDINQECLNEMIANLPDKLSGEWIKRNSSYEIDLCNDIGWIADTNRYFDARYGKIAIEIKKGKSIWLDLVRYSEIALGIGVKNTVTAFFIPDKDKSYIEKILFVYTDDIIRILKIDKDLAESLTSLNKNMPRSLNCQASLTVHDLSEIAFHTKYFNNK